MYVIDLLEKELNRLEETRLIFLIANIEDQKLTKLNYSKSTTI